MTKPKTRETREERIERWLAHQRTLPGPSEAAIRRARDYVWRWMAKKEMEREAL